VRINSIRIIVAMIAQRNMAKKYRQQSNRSLFSSDLPSRLPSRHLPSLSSVGSLGSLALRL
jgi:hypothetical protein